VIVYIENSDLLTVDSGIIAHGCNAQGVFGAGVAKQIAEKYPNARVSYLNHLREMSKRELDALGTVDFHSVSKDLLIANMITQEFYGRTQKVYVDYSAIHATMQRVVLLASKLNLPVHIPYMIGCGLGGGNVEAVTQIYNSFPEKIYCHKLHHEKEV
jgi:O-acetyl-ADP-ribose deacetylase (regulator of RNase III)